MQQRPVLRFNLQGNIYDVLCLQFILITLNNTSLLLTKVMPVMQRYPSTFCIRINFHRTLMRKKNSIYLLAISLY